MPCHPIASRHICLLSDTDAIFLGHRCAFDGTVACGSHGHQLPAPFFCHQDGRSCSTSLEHGSRSQCHLRCHAAALLRPSSRLGSLFPQEGTRRPGQPRTLSWAPCSRTAEQPRGRRTAQGPPFTLLDPGHVLRMGSRATCWDSLQLRCDRQPHSLSCTATIYGTPSATLLLSSRAG